MAPALITPHGVSSVLTRPGEGTALLVPAVVGVWAGGGEGPGALWPIFGLSCDISAELFSPVDWGAGMVTAILLL